MMTQAFYTGVSGLRTNQHGIDVVSDNLANINTVGFRSSNAEFSSLFEKTLNTTHNNTSNSVGIGSMLQATSLNQTQGSLMLSDRNTDLAIMGDGWFGVEGNNNIAYTRDGSFKFDALGDLVTNDGFHVLGTMGGNINAETLGAKLDEVKLGDVTSQEKLSFPKFLTYPQEATTKTKFTGNLGTENETRSMSSGVIDSTGTRNNLKLIFTKSVPQTLPGSQWDIEATTETLDGTTVYDTQNGKVSFDDKGALISSTLSSINNNGSQITIDLGNAYDGVVSNNGLISSSSSSDGIVAGELTGYSINQNAEIISSFSNGMQSSVGKIAVYHFQNDQGLQRVGSSKFTQSSDSGLPIFYTDINGQNVIGSSVSNFSLENSNVEMSNALTELIILQRSFDASSKSVTTADEMMQKALSMDA